MVVQELEGAAEGWGGGLKHGKKAEQQLAKEDFFSHVDELKDRRY